MDWGRSQKPWCFIPPNGVVLDVFPHFGDIQKWIMGIFRMEFPVCGFFCPEFLPTFSPGPSNIHGVRCWFEISQNPQALVGRQGAQRLLATGHPTATEVGETVEQ